MNQSPRAITIQGPWAFFHLLDRAQIVGVTANSIDYRFDIDGGDVVYRLSSDANVNSFTASLFKNLNLSSTLY